MAVYKLAVRAVAIIFDAKLEKVLVIKRADKFWGDVYSLTSGTLEKDEKLVDCLKREVKENLGLEVINEKFLDFDEIILKDKNRHFINMNYIVQTKGELKPNEKEIAQADWLDLKKIDTYPLVDGLAKKIKIAKILYNRLFRGLEMGA